jgi:hypothetical protein
MTHFPSSPSEFVTARREFLGQLATAAVALAGTACAAQTVAGAQAAAPAQNPAGATPTDPASKTVFDDSWTQRLTAKHKAVFDSPELADGAAIYQAQIWSSGFKEMYHLSDADTQAVLVFRHAGVPMVFNDAIWSKYEIGKRRKVKDEAGHWAIANSHVKDLEEAKARGAIILGCNLAAMGIAASIARDTKQDPEAVRQEIRSNLIPGALLMPSGIFALHRAQEAGCTYMRSG